jgi:hypothetical protein
MTASCRGTIVFPGTVNQPAGMGFRVEPFGMSVSEIDSLFLCPSVHLQSYNHQITPTILYQATKTALRANAASNKSADDPLLANTCVDSISLYRMSRYWPAPERWATLAHAACKARYRGSGRAKSGCEDTNVTMDGRPRSNVASVAHRWYEFGTLLFL